MLPAVRRGLHTSAAHAAARTTSAGSAQTFVALRAYFLRQTTRPQPTFACQTRRLLHATRARTNDKPRSEPPQDPQEREPVKPEQYTRLFQRLARNLPTVHRPSRDDFLAVTTNFWQRVRIRFRWFAIKSFRPFNVDDLSAFFSWFLVGQTLWILIGTTTFSMVVFATINSLSLQSYVARAISDYLTRETGITIVFESAVVPKWKDSSISFKNVYVSRRPTAKEAEEDPECTNISMFDLDVDSIDVTLSLWRWLDGKGIVTDAVVKGVRGVLDRTNVQYDPDHPLDPACFRHPARPGDFELESLQIEDLLITVYQPGLFRPYTASIFRADMRRLRKQWLFYDFLAAESIVGQFDNCLFSVHKPQSVGRTMEEDVKGGRAPRMSRFRIDGVNIDHLQYMSGTQGPISWITSGKLDAVLDITFPREESDDIDLKVIISEIAANIQAVDDLIPGQRVLAKPPLHAPSDDDDRDVEQQEERKVVAIDMDLRFRDVKATVPLFTRDLSYVNYALVRPMVAFVNANKTLIPIHCTVVKDLGEFDGSWTMWEAGLIDAIGLKTYEALAYHVTHNLNRRVKTVSLWGLHVTAQAIVGALKNIVDPVSVHLRDLYHSSNPSYDFA
ncbi:hypothetical protein EXIGLDRAFT_667637 [Exidia glandulosa HHB12029]|uniref:Mitochondrial distribution and morphology protein family 31/32 n=1 Tax=Exidia glandulosa HHB12029 TaxID=1314781 RepID=A0A165N6A8_EXIGL|nr:hypothetical protein EXIGLDRAFT_667637 [Exidia glandulosa HHB12029]